MCMKLRFYGILCQPLSLYNIMFALITNDDGINAPGIAALEKAAREVFDEILVVAPAGQTSAISQAITLSKSFRMFRRDANHVALEAYPADCVFFALRELVHRRPDFVLSGVNQGPNLGYDTLYSGTVGGAREGLMNGIPSLAFSLAGTFTSEFGPAHHHLVRILREVAERGLPPETMLNVNVPSPDVWGPAKGYRFCHLGRRVFDNRTAVLRDPLEGEHGWMGGRSFVMAGDEGSDCYALKNGYVTLSCLTWNLSCQSVKECEGWKDFDVDDLP